MRMANVIYLSLSLTGFVVGLLPTGEKESKRIKQNGGNKRSATN
jgi:hypothetical protein